MDCHGPIEQTTVRIRLTCLTVFKTNAGWWSMPFQNWTQKKNWHQNKKLQNKNKKTWEQRIVRSPACVCSLSANWRPVTSSLLVTCLFVYLVKDVVVDLGRSSCQLMVVRWIEHVNVKCQSFESQICHCSLWWWAATGCRPPTLDLIEPYVVLSESNFQSHNWRFPSVHLVTPNGYGNALPHVLASKIEIRFMKEDHH